MSILWFFIGFLAVIAVVTIAYLVGTIFARFVDWLFESF